MIKVIRPFIDKSTSNKYNILEKVEFETSREQELVDKGFAVFLEMEDKSFTPVLETKSNVEPNIVRQPNVKRPMRKAKRK